MGCSSSSLLMPEPCGSAHDELEWDSARKSTDVDDANAPLKIGCAGCSSTTRANFDLSKFQATEPPFLGSAYWLDNDDEVIQPELSRRRFHFSERTTPPPKLASLSPYGDSSSRSFETCSTSDNTILISNQHSATKEALLGDDNSSIGSFSPRRLFDDNDESPTKETLCFKDQTPTTRNDAVVHHGVLIKGTVDSPKCLHKRRRRIDTLPSQSQPIRLRVVAAFGFHFATDCSFDPYYSTGKLDISTCNGSAYGNALQIQVGPTQMVLQEGSGKMVAVMRSRHLLPEPSHVIYGPKPRYSGQIASDAVTLESNSQNQNWFPWALVKKDGPSVADDATVCLHQLDGWGDAFLKSRHGFNGNVQTHTVVTRVLSELEEVPCCLVLRDPLDHDVLNVTIAPGIDPILIICYLAVHTKMDVEPLQLASLSSSSVQQ